VEQKEKAELDSKEKTQIVNFTPAVISKIPVSDKDTLLITNHSSPSKRPAKLNSNVPAPNVHSNPAPVLPPKEDIPPGPALNVPLAPAQDLNRAMKDLNWRSVTPADAPVADVSAPATDAPASAVEDPAPAIDAPAMDAPAPAVETPSLADNVPTMNDTAPAVEATAPETDDSAPVIDDPAPKVPLELASNPPPASTPFPANKDVKLIDNDAPPVAPSPICRCLAPSLLDAIACRHRKRDPLTRQTLHCNLLADCTTAFKSSAFRPLV